MVQFLDSSRWTTIWSNAMIAAVKGPVGMKPHWSVGIEIDHVDWNDLQILAC